ncbi:NUDIX domain-containing protein [Kineosporia sp. J2-2]|uniref:NUDIX domain-containing protein n=1 Tax=Kineosporia corallincola TaxID=2835133 RepID=A0ABS5TP36_9ACTN|nr:NUDIX domain-containing protein [Kineosporia corallincola]MBT0771354.1 NUDIX domain-containing protein [Kineosporia corallincola]
MRRSERDIFARLAGAQEALTAAAELPAWDAGRVLSADSSLHSGIGLHVSGRELGFQLAARLLPQTLCRRDYTTIQGGFEGSPGRVVHFTDWYGTFGGQALNLTVSWNRPLVESELPAQELAAGVAAGWADPQNDPAEIDWSARQARALIPFSVSDDGRPCIPGPSTGIHRGRHQMGRWGESAMADALVTADLGDGQRWLLLVERADGNGWAMPGGGIEPGESPAEAAQRELVEESDLRLPASFFEAGQPQLVPDPRASDEAWAVTVVCRTHMDRQALIDRGVARLPEVHGADDARRAVWLPANTYVELTQALARDADGGRVFAAHVDILTAALG